MSDGPLDGLFILDLTRLLPGGYATLLLADLGADVVKVEEPGKGDYIRWTPPIVGEFSSAHIALNRNKRSITLNLKSDEGRDLFVKLAGKADVVVESFRPGVMDRLGVGWERLKSVNDGLIYCAISGYGQDGPRQMTAGHDVDYMAFAGALSIMGAEDKPSIPGLQIGDLGGGGMAAVIALLAALHKRDATGEGSFCDISMQDGITSWLSIHAAEFFATGKPPLRERMHLSGAYPCYRIYPASDGWLAVGALEPQFWTALCSAIDRDDLINDGFAMGERRDQVIEELEVLFSQRTRAQWMETLGDVDACVAPVNDFEEAFADPQVNERQMVVDGSVAGQAWRHVGNPIKISGSRAALVRREPPRLGEHTSEVLGSIGVEPDALEELRSRGVV
ncbi:MAG: CaiB/BaiF CoA transferase family protein [Actinomycetota bacterium]